MVDIDENQEKFPTVKNLTETLPAPMIDEVAGGLIVYYGWARLGVRQNEAKWKIMRITRTNAAAPHGVITTEYAGGSMKYDQTWSLRANIATVYSR